MDVTPKLVGEIRRRKPEYGPSPGFTGYSNREDVRNGSQSVLGTLKPSRDENLGGIPCSVVLMYV